MAQSKKKRPPIMAVAGVVVNQLDDSQSPRLSENLMKKNNVGVFLGGEYLLKGAFSVELNMIAANWQYTRQVESDLVTQLSTRLHFPILLRWNFWKYFSVGLGGFASYRLGDIKNLNMVPESTERPTSANNYGNHGLEGSLRLILPLARTKTALLLDFRYSQSLTAQKREQAGWQSFILGLRRRI